MKDQCGSQFHRLAEASAAIHRPLTVEEVLEVVTRQARLVVCADHAITSLCADGGWDEPLSAVSSTDTYSEWCSDRGRAYGWLIDQRVCEANQPLRLTQEQLEQHAAWRDVDGGRAAPQPPLRNWLAVPLLGRSRDNLGLIRLCGKRAGDFTDDDESALVLMAQMASVAIENALLYEAVRDSTERLRAVIDASPLAIYELDLEGRVQLWNRAAEALFGWSARETVGTELPNVPAAMKDQFQGLSEQIAGGETVTNVETVRQRRDGTLVEVAISGAPVRSRENEIVGTIRVVADISERRRLEQRLRLAQKMEAIGRLAGGIAHDFSNLLTAVLGNAELLSMTGALKAEGRQNLEEIRDAARHGQGMIRQLLAVGRQQWLEPVQLDLHHVVVSLSTLLKRLIGDAVDLRIVCHMEGATVLADRSQLEQVVVNLAVNARDAMPDGGTLTISIAPATAVAGQLEAAGGQEREYVMLTVCDDGIGMAPGVLERLFEPFFTTKSTAAGAGPRGTGLGLPTVYGIVTQSGGFIRVDSAPGEGTAFHVYLPLLGEPPVLAASLNPSGCGNPLHASSGSGSPDRER